MSLSWAHRARLRSSQLIDTLACWFIGTLLIVLTNWSKLIEKYIKAKLKKHKEGLDQSSNFD